MRRTPKLLSRQHLKNPHNNLSNDTFYIDKYMIENNICTRIRVTFWPRALKSVLSMVSNLGTLGIVLRRFLPKILLRKNLRHLCINISRGHALKLLSHLRTKLSSHFYLILHINVSRYWSSKRKILEEWRYFLYFS